MGLNVVYLLAPRVIIAIFRIFFIRFYFQEIVRVLL